MMRLLILALTACALHAQPATPAAAPPFAATIAQFSEPNGFFDTDNLISNEKSFLHVMGPLKRQDVTGGIYIGVGPDQNFSYLAQIRPTVAFLMDIRRDNLLGHLMFRALFAAARNRTEYLCLLLGREPPAPELPATEPESFDRLIAYLDQTPQSNFEAAAAEIEKRILTYGLDLSKNDLKVIRRIHERFSKAGLDLIFETHGRRQQDYYPRLRDLIRGRDAAGNYASYLATEESYQAVKKLQAEGRIIPLVGNLAGPQTLRRIAAYAKANQLTLSAFYASNVEQYLFRESNGYERFVRNLATIPRTPKSVVIRSCFGPYARGIATGDSYSAQLLQSVDHLIAAQSGGQITSFMGVVRLSQVGR